MYANTRPRVRDFVPGPVGLCLLVFCLASGIVLLNQVLPSLRGEPQMLFEKPPIRTSYVTDFHLGDSWPGWEGIETLMIFGDSWTSTDFDTSGAQPSHENPLGNPTFPGSAATNGPNWVGYLTAKHNLSFVSTLNFAYGGSTVDTALISPDALNLKSLMHMVEKVYMPNYGSGSPLLKWDPSKTLFAIWIGLNDIHNADADTAKYFGRIQEELAETIEKLHDSGAENFVFLNIPPIQRSPLAAVEPTATYWKSWVTAWNRNLTEMAHDLTAKHPQVTTFIFDNYKLFNDVQDSPCSIPECCGFKDTSTFCGLYAFGTDAPDSYNPKCAYSVDKYLWMNDLHPTTPMFDAIAHEIVKGLM